LWWWSSPASQDKFVQPSASTSRCSCLAGTSITSNLSDKGSSNHEQRQTAKGTCSFQPNPSRTRAPVQTRTPSIVTSDLSTIQPSTHKQRQIACGLTKPRKTAACCSSELSSTHGLTNGSRSRRCHFVASHPSSCAHRCSSGDMSDQLGIKSTLSEKATTYTSNYETACVGTLCPRPAGHRARPPCESPLVDSPRCARTASLRRS